MFKSDMLAMGITGRLSEVDRCFEDTRSRIQLLAKGLGLTKIVEAEAYSVLISLSDFPIKGARVDERAAFCIYIAGKRQNCPAADVNCLTKVLTKEDDSWTKGRILRAIWKIYKRTDFDSIGASPVSAYVDHIFAALMAGRKDVIPAVRLAYGEATRMVRTTKGAFGSVAPRRHAAWISFLALRDVPWESLGITPVGAREIFDAAGVWPKKLYSKAPSGRRP